MSQENLLPCILILRKPSCGTSCIPAYRLLLCVCERARERNRQTDRHREPEMETRASRGPSTSETGSKEAAGDCEAAVPTADLQQVSLCHFPQLSRVSRVSRHCEGSLCPHLFERFYGGKSVEFVIVAKRSWDPRTLRS